MTSQPTTHAAEPGGPVRRRVAVELVEAPPPQAAFFTVLWGHKVALVAGALVGALVGLLISFLQPVSYTSESRIFFSSQSIFDPLGSSTFTSDPTRYLQQQAALLTSEPVLLQAVENDSTIGDVTEVRDALDVTASAVADIVTLTAEADSAPRAAARVAAVVNAYRDVQRAVIADRVSALSDLSTAGERRQIGQRAALYGDGVSLVEPASTSEVSSLIRNTTVGGLVGLLLALAFALTRRRPAPAAADVQTFPGARQPSGHDSEVDDDWEWELVRRG